MAELDQSPEPMDLVWGSENIAKVLGKTRRATLHLLDRKQIPATKIGSQWVVSRKKLREVFEGAA